MAREGGNGEEKRTGQGRRGQRSRERDGRSDIKRIKKMTCIETHYSR